MFNSKCFVLHHPSRLSPYHSSYVLCVRGNENPANMKLVMEMRRSNSITNLPPAIATTASRVDPDRHVYEWGEREAELRRFLKLLFVEVRAHVGHK